MAYPTLRSNEVLSALYNQIISIQTEAKNISGVYGKLLEAMKVDGSMYGDTKLYIESDALTSSAWGNDAEASNLLALHRPPAPNTQAIVLDKFRQVACSVDDYMSKRAFSDENSFSSFNSVVRAWVGDTKKIYDATTFNAAVGTMHSSVQSDVSVVEANYPSLGQGIGQVIADLLVKMQDVSRDYNDLGFLRSFSSEDIIILWNSKYCNEVKKIDLPALFHKEGLIEKFEDYVLPERYFGEINTAQQAAGTGERSLIEQVLGSGASAKHVFAGDLIPAGLTAPAGTSYTEDSSVICKVMAKGSVPFMSSFSVGSSFINPKSLTETQFLTWSHNTLEYLKGKPFVTIKKA